ncbi:MAG: CDC48 family AAA ATPase [Candidatus Woesearchaeota archaeon]|jgi:transitional endoplasmic reticulum ATPase|nr:CDC48 family AAA ATPase [Candidatus Woesearchaeota archaeon]MDP7622561.1 CDC48 family AAA ATPase [Candidatus Woesearchaeota archaeon]HJN57273.1 CDC48 family AAA ATPase [Candidatus Woesearchaeota archaeon]|tara:strand:+ start:1529 stop:3805 length:2277 start_codon:yes stop_codon:yes gene_type:complete
MAEKEIKLKVAEAIQDDVNKGIVRIDSSFLTQVGIRPGDIVELEGERKTVAIADRAYPGDIGLNIVRMDGIIRKNSKTGIGEIISVRKANVKEGKKVIIAPARKGIVIRASPEIFKQGLLGRALTKGDIVSLGGTRRRRSTMSESPFFEDVFSILDESMMGFGFGDIKFIVIDINPKQPIIITEQTEIIFNPEAVEAKEELVPEVTYEDIGGLSDEIKKIREMVELPLKHPEIFERLGIEAPKGVLLHGSPGTGKTLLAKAVANETNSHFILINGPEIMSKYYGQSEENIRKKFEEAQKNAPSIIFIDEIDAIASKREETKGEVERRVVAQLLALMDGLKSRGKVVVIAATNVPNILDPALRRPGRFDREIEIGVPRIDGRLNILKIHTRNMPLAKNVNLKELSSITHGFVGADLSSLAKEAAMIVLRKILPDLKLKEEEPIPKEVLEKLRISQKDFREALKVVRPSALREVLVEIPNIKWEDIGGLETVKQELIEAVEWPLKHPESFKRLGVNPPKGILLYGAPGTGKTMLAKAVANESQANFILVKGPELLSKWVGESEKAVREVFKKARQVSPCIVFFDEIDSLAPKRGLNSDSHVSERVVNQMLTEIDGLEEMHDVVIIAATNRPDMVDTALLRPGRFDRIILTPVPDEKTRLEVFKVHTAGMPLKDINLENLAKKTEGYAGSDIESVCREAAIFALREDMESKEISIRHFEKAIEKVPPSISKEIEKAYSEMRDALSAARANQMKEEKPVYMG